jgi:hypothetical protein
MKKKTFDKKLKLDRQAIRLLRAPEVTKAEGGRPNDCSNGHTECGSCCDMGTCGRPPA